VITMLLQLATSFVIGVDGPLTGILTPEFRGVLTLLFMAATLTLMYYLVLKSTEQRRPKRTATLTTIECASCDFKDKREFMKSDYVGKTIGNCPKCGAGTLYITLIYAEEIE